MPRPVLYVLAGVNGAGKSSVGGYLLTQAGLAWYNPDTFARVLVRDHGYGQEDANGLAWQEGVRRLDHALAHGLPHAFETTLGGTTIAQKLRDASASHDVMMWFCGLDSPARHIARVRQRVAQGGHDIPEERIRLRCVSAIRNLVALMPTLAHLRVYDNSAQAEVGAAVPEPWLLLEWAQGRRLFPATLRAAADTPDWAKPVLEAAFQHQRRTPSAAAAEKA